MSELDKLRNSKPVKFTTLRTCMDILQPQADLQPLVGSQKCCLQPEMDSLSVLKVWVRQGEPRPSLPAGFPVKKRNIRPLFHFLNHSQDENLGLLKHIIKVDPSINLLHCRIHLGQKSSKIQKRLTNVCHLHISLSQFVIMLAQKTNFHHIFCLLLNISDDIFHLRPTPQ